MVSLSDQNLDPESPKRRGHQFWTGAILSPLPMVICLVVADALIGGISTVTVAFALIACVVVWVPLFVSRALLRVTSWSSLKANLSVMFVVSFIPMLSVYRFHEFNPDARLAYEINNRGTQLIEFSVTGIVIAVMAGLINMLCMWIFWRFSVRSSEDLSAKN